MVFVVFNSIDSNYFILYNEYCIHGTSVTFSSKGTMTFYCLN